MNISFLPGIAADRMHVSHWCPRADRNVAIVWTRGNPRPKCTHCQSTFGAEGDNDVQRFDRTMAHAKAGW